MSKLTIIAAVAAPLAAIAGTLEVPSVKFAGATREDYIKENISIFDFELTAAEMAKIRALNKEKLFFNPPPGSERMYLNGSFLEQ